MNVDHETLLDQLKAHLHPSVLDLVSSFLLIRILIDEFWEVPNPAGFAKISAISPVLQPFFLEKMVFPQLE